jgi:hypothetical protein
MSQHVPQGAFTGAVPPMRMQPRIPSSNFAALFSDVEPEPLASTQQPRERRSALRLAVAHFTRAGALRVQPRSIIAT